MLVQAPKSIEELFQFWAYLRETGPLAVKKNYKELLYI
jgi:hypothetical protein